MVSASRVAAACFRPKSAARTSTLVASWSPLADRKSAVTFFDGMHDGQKRHDLRNRKRYKGQQQKFAAETGLKRHVLSGSFVSVRLRWFSVHSRHNSAYS
jgi:hypothetical protein